MMLEHLISVNELEEEFRYYGLDPKGSDLTFIKNLMLGCDVRGEGLMWDVL